MSRVFPWKPAVAVVAAATCPLLLQAADPQPDSSTEVVTAEDFVPDQSRLPTSPPADAVVLFDGKQTNLFLSKHGTKINWPVEDGSLISSRGKAGTNHIVSQLHFRDADLHVEFKTPTKGSGNSGVYIHGNYELQILNSRPGKKLDNSAIGAIYGFSKPLVDAARKAGEWQVYDIRYRAPRRNADGKIVRPGSITAWLNGKKVQDRFRFDEPRSVYHPYRYQTTPYLQAIWKRQKQTSVGPVFLQDHHAPTRFRNVWVRPLDKHAFIYQPATTSNKSPAQSPAD